MSEFQETQKKVSSQVARFFLQVGAVYLDTLLLTAEQPTEQYSTFWTMSDARLVPDWSAPPRSLHWHQLQPPALKRDKTLCFTAHFVIQAALPDTVEIAR